MWTTPMIGKFISRVLLKMLAVQNLTFMKGQLFMRHGVISLKTLGFVLASLATFSGMANAEPNQTIRDLGAKELYPVMQNPALENISLKTAITDHGMIYFDEQRGIYLTQVMPLEKVDGEFKYADAQLIQDFVKQIPEPIVIKAPNEKIEVTMFTDITCGWCQNVHQNIDKYLSKGISFRFVLYPRDGLKGQVARQMTTIIESADPAQTLQAAFNGQYITPALAVNKTVEAHFEAGEGIMVKGTPTFVLDGRPFEGRLLPEQIIDALNK